MHTSYCPGASGTYPVASRCDRAGSFPVFFLKASGLSGFASNPSEVAKHGFLFSCQLPRRMMAFLWKVLACADSKLQGPRSVKVRLAVFEMSWTGQLTFCTFLNLEFERTTSDFGCFGILLLISPRWGVQECRSLNINSWLLGMCNGVQWQWI